MKPMPLEIRTLSDRLVEVLRDFILSGAIEPDFPIRQDSLAAELRVSKIPLREALARLEQDGLVISQPNRGFFVRPMSPEEAEEIYALRLKLEPDAVAAKLVHAVEARHPKRRYYVTTPTYIASAMRRFLPVSLIDRVMRNN